MYYGAATTQLLLLHTCTRVEEAEEENIRVCGIWIVIFLFFPSHLFGKRAQRRGSKEKEAKREFEKEEEKRMRVSRQVSSFACECSYFIRRGSSRWTLQVYTQLTCCWPSQRRRRRRRDNNLRLRYRYNTTTTQQPYRTRHTDNNRRSSFWLEEWHAQSLFWF